MCRDGRVGFAQAARPGFVSLQIRNSRPLGDSAVGRGVMVRGAHGLSVSPLTACASFGRVSRLRIHSWICVREVWAPRSVMPVVLLQHCSVCLGTVVLMPPQLGVTILMPALAAQSVQSGRRNSSVQTVSYPENGLVSLADFPGFVCEVSNPVRSCRRFRDFEFHSLFFAATWLSPTCHMVNKNVSYGLLTGDAFDWTTNEPSPS